MVGTEGSRRAHTKEKETAEECGSAADSACVPGEVPLPPDWIVEAPDTDANVNGAGAKEPSPVVVLSVRAARSLPAAPDGMGLRNAFVVIRSSIQTMQTKVRCSADVMNIVSFFLLSCFC